MTRRIRSLGSHEYFSEVPEEVSFERNNSTPQSGKREKIRTKERPQFVDFIERVTYSY